MAKALVIAEKPSLGRSIVSAISWWKNEKFTRQGKDRNTWLESDNYIVASSVGHLYELIDLDAYFPDYDPEKKHPWTMDRLPFFPNDIPGFSVEEMCAPAYWFAEDRDGPWEWIGKMWM